MMFLWINLVCLRTAFKTSWWNTDSANSITHAWKTPTGRIENKNALGNVDGRKFWKFGCSGSQFLAARLLQIQQPIWVILPSFCYLLYIANWAITPKRPTDAHVMIRWPLNSSMPARPRLWLWHSALVCFLVLLEERAETEKILNFACHLRNCDMCAAWWQSIGAWSRGSALSPSEQPQKCNGCRKALWNDACV